MGIILCGLCVLVVESMDSEGILKYSKVVSEAILFAYT